LLDISEEIFNLMKLRPSLWVTNDLDVLTTESRRMFTDKFIMCAADGKVSEFLALLESGKVELTSLHSQLNYTALHAAADFGKVALVQEIVKTGMSLNVRDPRRGQTALHFAAQTGRCEVVELLLRNNADRLIKCNSGFKPYQVADRLGYIECRELLKHLPPSVKLIKVSFSSLSFLNFFLSYF
jgi:ankyrin repeat protein